MGGQILKNKSTTDNATTFYQITRWAIAMGTLNKDFGTVTSYTFWFFASKKFEKQA